MSNGQAIGAQPTMPQNARDIVLKAVPSAFSWDSKNEIDPTWWIDRDTESPALGFGATEEEAWANAAARIQSAGESQS